MAKAGQLNLLKGTPNIPVDGKTGFFIDADDVPFLIKSDGTIIPFAASELSTEILQALNGATSPSSSNTFVTFADISNVLGQSSYLVYGGNVQYSGTGLVFNGSPSGVVINNVFLEFASDTITLDAADTTNDRRDRFIINESGWDKLTGTPSVTPIAPVANNITEVGLGDVLIEANATTPSDITDEDVYKENVEWAGSKTGTGTVAFDSTNDPFEGTVSVEATNIQNGLRIIFTASADINKNDFESIGLQIKLKATMNNGRNLSVYFRNAASAVISSSQNLPLTKNNSSSYQFTGVDFDSFTWSSNLIRQVVFEYIGSGGPPTYSGFFMDNIIIQSGIETPVEPADISFLQLNDTPSTYSGQSERIVRVKTDETGLEFVVDGGGGGVQSVTGDGVDNTDPDNPVISLAPVAVSGDYDDLDNKPSLAFVETVTGLNVDITDPLNPIIEYPEGVILTSNTVVFNVDNVSGITTARTGNVLVDLTNAKVYGTFTMIHNDAAAFGFFLPDGVTPFVFYQSNTADYVAGEDNILDFQFIGDGKVRLTISQPD
jgi:hypothetical protein